MVLVAVALVVLVGMAALAIDLGQAHMAKQRLHDVCDAAAIAAAWALEPSASNSLALATAAAESIVEENNKTRTVKVTNPVVTPSDYGKTISVRGDINIVFGFARVLGDAFKSGTVSAESSAVLENEGCFTYRFVPLAVTDSLVKYLEPGEPVQLSTPFYTEAGVFKQLRDLQPVIFGEGSFVEEDYASLLRGKREPFVLATKGDGETPPPSSRVSPISIDATVLTCDNLGDDLSTGRTYGDNWSWDTWRKPDITDLERSSSKRIVILPVVDREERTQIVGFAGFFIESVERYDDRDPVTNEPRHCVDIWGRFVPGVVGRKSMRWMQPFAPDGPNLMYRVRLIR